jgi:alpha-beta hydrolase superfamily lysophospholipase
MNKENVRGYNGYDIPCLSRIKGSEKLVVLISHGFGSNKESPTAKALCSALSERGIGSCSYDFPAHGESPADGGMLRIHNCLDDLSAVEEQNMPDAVPSCAARPWTCRAYSGAA